MTDYGTSDIFDIGNTNMLDVTIPEKVTTESQFPFGVHEEVPINIEGDRELIESTGEPVIMSVAATSSVVTVSDIWVLYGDDEPRVVESSDEFVQRKAPRSAETVIGGFARIQPIVSPDRRPDGDQ